jgi:hypothetical protein
VFLDTASKTFDAVSPFPAPHGGSVEEAAATGAQQAAVQYVVKQGLVSPLKSSVYRLFTFAETVTELVPLVQATIAVTVADYKEAKAKFVDRSCQ